MRRVKAPKYSERQKALKDIDTLVELLIPNLSESEDEESKAAEDIDGLLLIKAHIESTRNYLPCSPIPKDSGLRELLLPVF